MLELKSYTRAEMSVILGTKTLDNMRDKLDRYGVIFECVGKRNRQVFTIKEITQPFKLYAIIELGCDANTDFKKLAYFLLYFFNDDTFAAMPDEVKEVWMKRSGHPLSRQTIAKYTAKLTRKELISRSTSEYLYYFAYQSQQTFTSYTTYRQAWSDYWDMIGQGCHSGEAIAFMITKYGGVARKQAVIDMNGLKAQEIEHLKQLVAVEIERNVASQF